MAEIALLALKLLHETSKKIPNFDERVRKQFYKSLNAYEVEFMKPEHVIDDQRLGKLTIALESQLRAFKKELQK